MLPNIGTLQRIYDLGLSKVQLCEVLLIIAEIIDPQNTAKIGNSDHQNTAKIVNCDAQNTAKISNHEHILTSSKTREVEVKEDTALSRKASTRMPPAREVAEGFEKFWRAYPKRINKQAALRIFERLMLSGKAASHLIDGAKAYATATQSTEKQFIKGPDAWLNKGCYDDEQPVELPSTNGHAGPAVVNGMIYVMRDTPQGDAWNDIKFKTTGKSQVWDKRGGWYFPTEYPPREDAAE